MGGIFLKVSFFGLISTTFEFSRQNDMYFFTKIDFTACEIPLKVKFRLFEWVAFFISQIFWTVFNHI